MVERMVYKTKLCVLYQKGHCHRQSCNFAHGDAERRRFSGSFDGRRDRRGHDLREKLDKRYSPPRRYSPRRIISGRHASYGDNPLKSPEKRSVKKRQKRQQPDGQSDFSGSLQTSNGTGDYLRDKNCVSSDPKDIHKIRELHSEIKKLEDRKKGLEVYLEDRSQEAENLTFRVKDLEIELIKENEECKRITSKIKKFTEAHKRLSHLHDEVKRSDAQLQKLGEKLILNASGASGDDLSLNAVTDGEAKSICPTICGNMKNNISPHKKRSQVNVADGESPSQGNEKIKLGDNPSRRNMLQIQYSNEKKTKADINSKSSSQNTEYEERPKGWGNISPNRRIVEKAKGVSDAASLLMLPSTGMAAHATDEVDVEVVEMEEKYDMLEDSSTVVAEEAVYDDRKLLYLPPPPPLPTYKNSLSQFNGGDENVDVDGGDEETAEVDII
ncbi:unnamed protein product [Cuscuta epithymum]|uniref:C3H1-type domain-containing protein n=2 Tax=Cuscuta epithymum TaxID=186058 RepID=A0AAV0CGS7_9ASTE|nr:unnamed protein product [Cuscuta epithymum]